MARPRKSASIHFSPGQAAYVLERLIKDRRVSQSEVSRYMSEMHHEISALELRLQSLRDAAGALFRRGTGRPPRSAQAAAAVQGARKRRTAITAEQRASRQLQGRYLGLIRQIPASRRAQYQKTAKEKGREAAIKDMVAALGK